MWGKYQIELKEAILSPCGPAVLNFFINEINYLTRLKCHRNNGTKIDTMTRPVTLGKVIFSPKLPLNLPAWSQTAYTTTMHCLLVHLLEKTALW